MTGLGAADRRRMDQFLTGIREIEMRIAASERDPITPPSEKPSGIPFEYRDYVKVMFDLQAIAFQADLTRVSTMMLGREGSVRAYPEIGVPDPHHPLTHHRGHPDFIEKVTKINYLPRRAVRRICRAPESYSRTETARCSIIPRFFTAAR